MNLTITQCCAQLLLLQQLLGAHENKRFTRHRAYLNGNTRSNNDENDASCRIGQMLPTRRLVQAGPFAEQHHRREDRITQPMNTKYTGSVTTPELNTSRSDFYCNNHNNYYYIQLSFNLPTFLK